MQLGTPFTPQLFASSIAQLLWLIPGVPIVTSGIIAVLKQPKRRMAAGLAIGSLAFSLLDRKSTRLNSSHPVISYAVFFLKKKKKKKIQNEDTTAGTTSRHAHVQGVVQ